MLDKINMLREILDEQVATKRPYNEILETSRAIDELLIEYYKDISLVKLVNQL